VDEGDPAPSCTETRGLIDQPVSSGSTYRQGGVEIRDSIADVVNAGPVAGEKLPDRARLIQRRQELHLGFTEWERDDCRPIHGFRGMRFETENISIEGERFLEVGDGNTDMRDAGAIEH
jgi:hypothetical protein